MSGTDQTDAITYVRPGGWSASVGIPGIDAHHTFADPGMDGPQPPEDTPGSIPTRGPSALTKAPAQNSRRWWQSRAKSNIELDRKGNNGQNEVTTDAPQPDTMRPRDPRTVPIPAPRWTGTVGPVLQYFFHRTTEGHMSGADRFVDHAAASFAFQPVTRQSPMALGDGRGTPRFRPTQRSVPTSLDNQVASIDQQAQTQGSVLMSGPGIQSYW